MSKFNLVGLHRLVLDLLSCERHGIQHDSDKSMVIVPGYVIGARLNADQKGFGERKTNAQNRTIQLH